MKIFFFFFVFKTTKDSWLYPWKGFVATLLVQVFSIILNINCKSILKQWNMVDYTYKGNNIFSFNWYFFLCTEVSYTCLHFLLEWVKTNSVLTLPQTFLCGYRFINFKCASIVQMLEGKQQYLWNQGKQVRKKKKSLIMCSGSVLIVAYGLCGRCDSGSIFYLALYIPGSQIFVSVLYIW